MQTQSRIVYTDSVDNPWGKPGCKEKGGMRRGWGGGGGGEGAPKLSQTVLVIAYVEESEAGVGRPEMMEQGRVGSQITLTALQG